MRPGEIIEFWRAAGPQRWFAHDARFDEAIRERFAEIHLAAARGELDSWAHRAQGALALVILLDQFSRNLWRGSARAFATDLKARQIAGAAIGAGYDRLVRPDLRSFFYLPFEHSEDPIDQARSLALFEALEKETGKSARSARAHARIIARFGRFPHRNRALGRGTTPEEQAFLDAGGFAR